MSYEYERVPATGSGLRLHLNENTAGCSPMVVAALARLTRHDLATYPEYDHAIEVCAASLGVETGSLLLTNGLDEGILVAAIVALRGSSPRSPLEAIVVVPAFDMYAACSSAAGGTVIDVPLGSHFEFPVDRILETVGDRTRVVWLTNPNNPTGQSIPHDAIARIAAAAANAMVFVDEAYVDFGGSTLLGSALIARHPNLVVGRTFSKAYGLAGLRAGAVMGSVDIIAALGRVIPPYSVNACAAAALPAALADTDYYRWYVEQVAGSKAMLYDALERLGIAHWKSDANFVLARFPGQGARLAAALAARGVHVRDRSRDYGCADCVRITAGVVHHTRTLVAALEEVL